MDAWPSDLPQTIKADYQIQPRCGLVDDAEERNPERCRTYPEYDATFNIRMTSGQKDSFRGWWDDTLEPVCSVYCAVAGNSWLSFFFSAFHRCAKLEICGR